MGFSDPSFATKWQVNVANFVFTPASLPNVLIGDTVHFQWVSGTHTTTSTTIPAGAATWDHPITSTSQVFDYIPTVPGSYNYKCTIHAAMGMVGSFTVTYPTGISEQRNALGIDIFPNPVQNVAFIKMISDPAHVTGLKIYDITGKTIMVKDLKNLSQDQLLTIDLSTLNSGIYFALFTDNENGTTVKRIIKK
jgi:plastocyanin